jgi:predicted kinase
LHHHYVAYRAVVRAKVAGLRHDQGDPGAAPEVIALTELALHHLRAADVRLVLVGGLPGTGKSTVARGLADRFGATVLSSDRIRKEQAGRDPESRATADYGEGIYTPAHTDRVYTELLHRATELLGRGETVVLDASWTSAAHRARAAEVAGATSSTLVQLRCDADPGTARRRILTRVGGASDATAPVAAAMTLAADPWPAATTVPTGGLPAQAVERAAAVWRGSGR